MTETPVAGDERAWALRAEEAAAAWEKHTAHWNKGPLTTEGEYNERQKRGAYLLGHKHAAEPRDERIAALEEEHENDRQFWKEDVEKVVAMVRDTDKRVEKLEAERDRLQGKLRERWFKERPGQTMAKLGEWLATPMECGHSIECWDDAREVCELCEVRAEVAEVSGLKKRISEGSERYWRASRIADELVAENARLRKTVFDAWERMDRARRILIKNWPGLAGGWSMLDTSLDREALAATETEPKLEGES